MPQDIKSLRNRIKSVRSTLHLTKAMGLVASSKIRRAQEARIKSQQYRDSLGSIVDVLSASSECESSPYLNSKGDGKTKLLVIAGDRGLAGGYNSNVFRLADSLAKDTEPVYMPIGKKAVEHCRHKSKPTYKLSENLTSEVSVGDCFAISEQVARDFKNGEIDRVIIVYTRFNSMISQVPTYEQLLPIEREAKAQTAFDPIYSGDAMEMLDKIVPQYGGGILHTALKEALASESGARRTAMNAANKNASEMIDSLMLSYNRARQAVITQEITEIVAGQ